MTPGLHCSKSFRYFAALGCLLAVWCCDTSAEATCGEYLSHASEMASSQPEAPLAPATPCRGPNCRQTPEHPPLPTPQRIGVVPTRDILGLTVFQYELALDAQWLAVPIDLLSNSISGLSLFRPPRVVA